ncbi:MAG: SCO1664 family protein [Anaerolineae bacterium]|nr:SCO1664 family protein [Anaerolineae bacterium]
MADNSLPSQLDIDSLLHLLKVGELSEIHGLLPWSSNYTFLAGITHGELEILTIYKPRRGERPLWDFPDGTLCQREVAAFTVSEALGWCFVPPTVLRDGPQGIGMVQIYIHHDPEQHYFTLAQNPQYRTIFRRIVLFDHIINNADRKSGHCLLDRRGNVWAIDHGVSFHTQPKVRSVIWDFAGEMIEPALLEDIQRLADNLARDVLPRALLELLDAQELEALRSRMRKLLDTQLFPQPGPGMSYPWPPV